LVDKIFHFVIWFYPIRSVDINHKQITQNYTCSSSFAGVDGNTVQEVIGKDFRELVASEDLELVAD
jgi:hypothetical protein